MDLRSALEQVALEFPRSDCQTHDRRTYSGGELASALLPQVFRDGRKLLQRGLHVLHDLTRDHEVEPVAGISCQAVSNANRGPRAVRPNAMQVKIHHAEAGGAVDDLPSVKHVVTQVVPLLAVQAVVRRQVLADLPVADAPPALYREIGAALGVSGEWARRLHQEALARLRQPATCQTLRSLLARHTQADYESTDALVYLAHPANRLLPHAPA